MNGMDGDDRTPDKRPGGPEEQGPADDSQPASFPKDAGESPGSGSLPPPEWAPVPEWGGPGAGSWPPRQEKRGLFRQHPLLMILLLFLIAGAVVTIIGAAMSRQIGPAGVPAMSFGKKVGVIKIEGIIIEPREVVDQIHRFIDDGSIAAVVIRVDSPGGVVGAAQEIHSEVKRLARDKPVVVSMGSVAASGGYYVACPAQKIFANEGTITGSIGVVMEVTNLEGLFEWMKVKNVTLKSGEYKDAGSPYRDMTRKEREYLQSVVDDLHSQFEDAIADGRPGMEPEMVREISNGKIYTGTQAKELGLVDEIGTLWDAIFEAADMAGIKGKPRVVWPPRRSPNIFNLMGTFVKGLSGDSLIRSPVQVMYVMDIN